MKGLESLSRNELVIRLAKVNVQISREEPRLASRWSRSAFRGHTAAPVTSIALFKMYDLDPSFFPFALYGCVAASYDIEARIERLDKYYYERAELLSLLEMKEYD